MSAAAAYTGADTRIIMSFAMKNGGHLFSQWLRNKLMKEFDYYSANSVYLDTVASRQHPTEHSRQMPDPATHAEGITYVAPDERHVKAEGFVTVGAMNSGWNEAYTTAMSQASVMLFLMSPDYVASRWCVQEWAQFLEECGRRSADNPLFGLVICFNDVGVSEHGTAATPLVFDRGTMDKLTLARKTTTGGHHTALGAGGRGWAISESDFQRIVALIRPRLSV